MTRPKSIVTTGLSVPFRQARAHLRGGCPFRYPATPGLTGPAKPRAKKVPREPRGPKTVVEIERAVGGDK
ncbi:hypothetical protein VFPFJ_00963 [Purpureocillium lilacinum]|uniref:Uncharacterized protein n=1 Tax=Purpureocillium lilacinum TaxID=33203 RepID=A0A179HBS4_PURLI|nr:hypothetical protein VFPFJ_00963 [Purpureocillium lilacinum]OAQ86889.1 hypothetical protein VFPBJ_00929 [Purpureocillium lilacinum]OAQ94854.1 hypothetical protein VFPFJ_00963 [Purpureocillium lilacinum]